jgi:hypothetical protein
MAVEMPGAPLLASDWIGPKPGAFQPERRLMAAVLGVALADYQEYIGAQSVWDQRRFAAIEAWFASDDDGWPYSFVNVCAGLDLEVSSIRAAVRACRKRRIATSCLGHYGRGPQRLALG